MTEEAGKLADELKPCPFCGTAATIKRFTDRSGPPVGITHIECGNDETCKVCVDIQSVNEAVAIEAWNRRSQPGTLTREEVARTPAFDAMIANLAALDKQRSPGPWKKTHDNITSSDRSLDARLVARCDTDWGGGWKHDPTKASKNARFITALENAWPKILAILALTPSHDAGTITTEQRSLYVAPASQDATRKALELAEAFLSNFTGEGRIHKDPRDILKDVRAALASPARADRAVTADEGEKS